MKNLYSLFLCLLAFQIQAQYDTIYVAILPFASDSEMTEESRTKLQNIVADEFSKDYRMVLLDRGEFDVVAEERDRQRDEDFIDGKIVEQGKAIGAEYLVDGFVDNYGRQLFLKVYDVSDGSLTGSVVSSLTVKRQQKNLLGELKDIFSPTTRTEQLQKNVKQLINQCFSEFLYIVVGAEEESKKRVRSLKVYAGSKMGLKKGQLLEVQALVEEEVEGVITTRRESAGWGKIEKVDGESWCILKVEAGKGNIKKLLNKGTKLRCRAIKK
jgi:hypothetical protein